MVFFRTRERWRGKDGTSQSILSSFGVLEADALGILRESFVFFFQSEIALSHISNLNQLIYVLRVEGSNEQTIPLFSVKEEDEAMRDGEAIHCEPHILGKMSISAET